jgi:hypothetical protein
MNATRTRFRPGCGDSVLARCVVSSWYPGGRNAVARWPLGGRRCGPLPPIPPPFPPAPAHQRSSPSLSFPRVGVGAAERCCGYWSRPHPPRPPARSDPVPPRRAPDAPPDERRTPAPPWGKFTAASSLPQARCGRRCGWRCAPSSCQQRRCRGSCPGRGRGRQEQSGHEVCGGRCGRRRGRRCQLR